jgi:hypothetical protein
MPWHRFFGAATFVLGVATCCMGLVAGLGLWVMGFRLCAFVPRTLERRTGVIGDMVVRVRFVSF